MVSKRQILSLTTRLFQEIGLYLFGFIPAAVLTGIPEGLIRDSSTRGLRTVAVDVAAGLVTLVAPMLLVLAPAVILLLHGIAWSLTRHPRNRTVRTAVVAGTAPVVLVALGYLLGPVVPVWFMAFPVSAFGCTIAYGWLTARAAWRAQLL